MTVQCAYFEDPDNYAWNGYVIAEPDINATAGPLSPSIPGTFDGLKAMIVVGWNTAHPGEPVTVDDLEWVEVAPYRRVDDTEDDVFVVDMAAVRQLPPEDRMAAMTDRSRSNEA